MKEKTFLLAYSGKDPLEGSKGAECSKCRKKVSIAPSSQEIIKQREVEIVCLACAKKEKILENSRIQLTRGQI